MAIDKLRQALAGGLPIDQAMKQAYPDGAQTGNGMNAFQGRQNSMASISPTPIVGAKADAPVGGTPVGALPRVTSGIRRRAAAGKGGGPTKRRAAAAVQARGGGKGASVRRAAPGGPPRTSISPTPAQAPGTMSVNDPADFKGAPQPMSASAATTPPAGTSGMMGMPIPGMQQGAVNPQALMAAGLRRRGQGGGPFG